MFKLITVLFCSTLLTMLNACGAGNGSGKTVTNQTSLDGLSTLLGNHPDLSQATLDEIKVASVSAYALTVDNQIQKKEDAFMKMKNVELKNKDSTSEFGSSDAVNKNEKRHLVNREIATTAQELIDDILGNMDFEAFFDAQIKINGIYINEAMAMMELMKDPSLNKFGGKGDFMSHKFDDEGKKTITCEEIVDNPFIHMSRAQFERNMRHDKYMLEESLSGCSKITLRQFLECMQDLNRLVTSTNTYASCEDKSLRDLEKKITKNLGIDYGKLEYKVSRCLNTTFPACGFQQTEMAVSEQSRSESSLTDLNQDYEDLDLDLRF